MCGSRFPASHGLQVLSCPGNSSGHSSCYCCFLETAGHCNPQLVTATHPVEANPQWTAPLLCSPCLPHRRLSPPAIRARNSGNDPDQGDSWKSIFLHTLGVILESLPIGASGVSAGRPTMLTSLVTGHSPKDRVRISPSPKGKGCPQVFPSALGGLEEGSWLHT